MDLTLQMLFGIAEKAGPYGLAIIVFIFLRFNHFEHVAAAQRELTADFKSLEGKVNEILQGCAAHKIQNNSLDDDMKILNKNYIDLAKSIGKIKGKLGINGD